jgi:hypothetical protein
MGKSNVVLSTADFNAPLLILCFILLGVGSYIGVADERVMFDKWCLVSTPILGH